MNGTDSTTLANAKTLRTVRRLAQEYSFASKLNNMTAWYVLKAIKVFKKKSDFKKQIYLYYNNPHLDLARSIMP